MRTPVWLPALALLAALPAAAQRLEPMAAPGKPGWMRTTQGCHAWANVPVPNESASWTGACRGGRTEGNGVLTWHQGSGSSSAGTVIGRYEGPMRAGHAHGRGVYTWPNGNRYDGEFRDGFAHGPARYLHNGSLYEGDWKEGCYYTLGGLMLRFAMSRRPEDCP